MTGFFSAHRAGRRLIAAVAALLAAPQAHALNIVFDFAPGMDSYFNADASALHADVLTAGQNFTSIYTNDVTIHITVQADTSYNALASSIANYGAVTDYATVHNALVAGSSSSASVSAAAALSASAPASALSGGFRVATAESKALGLSDVNDTTSDGTIYIGASANWNFDGTTVPAAGAYSLVNAVEHEISEVMGRTTNLSQASWRWNSPIDLLRYTAPGVQDLTAAATGVYFSTDSGKTLARAYNAPNNNYADIQDWASSAVADPFDAYASAGQYLQMSQIDQELLNTLGWRSVTLADLVPEPDAWALMLTGFGLTGTAARRQRRAAAAAAVTA